MSKTIIVPTNAHMSYIVSKEGYSTVKGDVIVDEDKVVDVVLEEQSGVKFTLIPPPAAEYMSITVNGETEEVEMYEYKTSVDEFVEHYKREYDVENGTSVSYTFKFYEETGRYGDDDGYIYATETLVLNENTTKDFINDRTTITINYTIPIVDSTNVNYPKPYVWVTDTLEGLFFYLDIDEDLPEGSTTEIVSGTKTYEVPPYSYIGTVASHARYYPQLAITNSAIYPSDNYTGSSELLAFGLVLDYNNIIEYKKEG